ncbi:NUDIX hydrolase [Nocardioides sp.]|uniref:NUDIX domain-containing protein n=1 Tax=Nocardioides sp. TaxID=35761 RepID=UPI0027340E40|nr:NUDIX hydrolase [Nocardioides sp.]MDP3893491.1 NUDIX hydrolase [Nocardioides sp.]
MNLASPTVTTTGDGIARILAPTVPDGGSLAEAVSAMRQAVATALESHTRVETLVRTGDELGQRVATWSGLQREGVLRGMPGPDGVPADRVVYARLSTDPPVDTPEGFRTLLNSFLPRKRGIGQLLVRDPGERVLLCQLTYKTDWDLPGGVVEVGESPRLGVTREIEEELGLSLTAGELLLTDWLPPWSGWDDALCLVFDGGVHEAAITASMVHEEREIRSVAFCTLEEVAERCADFTARRVASALANVRGTGAAYTESGH